MPCSSVLFYIDFHFSQRGCTWTQGDISTSSVIKPFTDEDVAFALRSHLPKEESYESIGLLATDGEEVKVAPSLSQIENTIKQVTFSSSAISCIFLFLFLLLIVAYLVLQSLQSHFVRVGTALHTEQLNQARGPKFADPGYSLIQGKLIPGHKVQVFPCR